MTTTAPPFPKERWPRGTRGRRDQKGVCEQVCSKNLPFLTQAEFTPLFGKPVLSKDGSRGELKKK